MKKILIAPFALIGGIGLFIFLVIIYALIAVWQLAGGIMEEL